MKIMLKAKLMALFWITLVTLLGYLTCKLYSEKLISLITLHIWIEIIPYTLIAWAVLGRCGWEIQTWSGGTLHEKLDKYIFRIVYISAYYMIIAIFFVKKSLISY